MSWQEQSAAGYQAARQGRLTEAERLLRAAFEEAEASPAWSQPQEYTELIARLAQVLYDQGRDAEAEPFYQRLLEWSETVYGSEHPLVADPLIGLGNVYHNQGDYARAAPYYERGIALMEKSLGPEHPALVDKLKALTLAYYMQQEYAQAEPVCRRWLAMEKNAKGLDHADVVAPLMALADIQLGQGKLDSASEALDEALRLNPQNAYALASRSYALLNSDRFDACIADCNELLQLDPEGSYAATAHANRGAAWAYKGRFDKGLADFEASVKLDPDLAISHVWKGMILGRLGQDAQARIAIARGVEIDPGLADFDTTRLDHVLPQPLDCNHEGG
jgi:tetratricopeptide (TPR) repeat protein